MKPPFAFQFSGHQGSSSTEIEEVELEPSGQEALSENIPRMPTESWEEQKQNKQFLYRCGNRGQGSSHSWASSKWALP